MGLKKAYAYYIEKGGADHGLGKKKGSAQKQASIPGVSMKAGKLKLAYQKSQLSKAEYGSKSLKDSQKSDASKEELGY